MAMSANYVHIKQEVSKQKLRDQLDTEAIMNMNLPPSENTKLVFEMSDTGSFKGEDESV